MDNYNSKLNKDTVSNERLDKVIKALERLSDSEFISNNSFAEDIQNIINRLKDNSFRLAVVGEFSSGKSTFLNALIGKDILKHGAKETTATITEIQNASELIDGEVFDVYYENGDIKKNISIDQLQEYTATSSVLHQVAHEIRKVVIRSNLFDTNEDVCFVDTPGLNGIADNHREKTIEQIKNAHACIYLMQVRGFGQSDIEFIKFISRYQRNIIFVQNFIDELRELEDETVEGKLSEQKRILEEKILNENENVKYELVGISARKALIARDHMIETYENELLNDDVRKSLLTESRFASVLNSVMELMNRNEKDSVQKRETVIVAVELLEQLLDILQYQKEQEDEIWENSIEGKKKRNLEIVRDELQKNRKEYKKNIENYVEAESSNIRKLINKDVDKQLEEIYEKVKKDLSLIEDIDVFEHYAELLSQYLYDLIMKLEDRSNELMNLGFENLLCNAILRIKQYTGNKAKTVNVDKFKADESHGDSRVFKFEQDEDEILKLRKELADKQADLVYNRKQRTRLEASVRKLDNDLNTADDKIKSIAQQKNVAVSRLGSKPGVEIKYKPVPRKVYRGGLGILDFLFGPKIVTERVPYDDYSNQEKWLQKKSDIESTYKRQQDQIIAESRLLKDKMQGYQDDIKHLDKLEPQKQKDIQRIQALLDAKIENIEVKRKKAQKEYLRNQKNALLEEAYNYLSDEVRVCIKENFEKAVGVNKRKILTMTNKLFDISFDERIRILSDRTDESEAGKHKEKTEQNIKNVLDTINILEEYL